MKRTSITCILWVKIGFFALYATGCFTQSKISSRALSHDLQPKGSTFKQCVSNGATNDCWSQPHKKQCLRQGGTWKTFKNICQNSCKMLRMKNEGSGVSCLSLSSQGCYCGKDKCWNGKFCEFM